MSSFRIETFRDSQDPASFHVMVSSDRCGELGSVEALSLQHAERVAADLMLLVRQRFPDGAILLSDTTGCPACIH